jgi:gluconokinase
MFDKLRLHARGALPSDYHANLGRGFDRRVIDFLGCDLTALANAAASGADDAALLALAIPPARRPTDDACAHWNAFMLKRGWRDESTSLLQKRIAESDLAPHPIATFFDLIDYDEGRDPVRRRAWQLRPARAALVMGVAGSGKSTVGHALADALGWRFDDADAFHPPANVAKMAAGTPLDDTDRAPWLDALRGHLAARLHEGESLVLACSALKASYRRHLGAGPGTPVSIVYLHANPGLLAARLAGRSAHFMKDTMLASQLATLEPPTPAESLHADVSEPLATLIPRLAAALDAPAASA